MKSAKLSKLRDLIAGVARELSIGGATTKEIVDAVRGRYPVEIRGATEDLLRIALTRVVNDVRTRKASTSFIPGQGDLFAGFGVPSQVALKVPGQKDFQIRETTSLTYAELYGWYKYISKKRAAHTRRAVEARRLLKRIKPFSDGEVTVQEALLAAEAAEEKEAKKDHA